MKKYLLLYTLSFCALFAVKAQTTFVPDDAFESRLIQLGLDSGPLDDLVFTANISDLEDFDFGNFNVTDITGLQDFEALKDLRLDGGIADLSPAEGLVNLEVLSINDVLDTTFDFSALTNLQYLYIDEVSMTTVDFTNNSELIELSIEQSSVTEVVFGYHPMLEDVYFNITDIETLDFSGCEALRVLLINSTSALIDVDLSQNFLLERIEFDDNPMLSVMDLSTNTALNDVRAEDNLLLETIFIKNGNNTNIGQNFRVKDNPNLTCVEVDDVAWSNTFWGFTTDNFQGFSLSCGSPSTTVMIPDPNFEQALIDLGIDSDGIINGQILESDALGVTDLDVNSYNISDLTGIEFFTDLEVLTVFNNNVATVDLSQNTQLTTILLALNNLTEIDLSNHSNLISLSLNDNNLNTIDLSNNLLLTQLFLNQNNLTEIDLSMLLNLQNLGLRSNAIVELDLSQNPNITTLFCDDNALVSLVVNNGNNINFTNFEAQNNAELSCIQVDDVSYSNTNWLNAEPQFNFDAQVTFGLDCAPTNDDCVEATVLTLGELTAGTTISATSSTSFPSCQADTIVLIDVWYQFTAPSSGIITAIASAALNNLNVNVAIYNDCNEVQPISCDSGTVEVNNLVPGQTYYVQLWIGGNPDGRFAQNTNQVGDFTIEVFDTTTLSIDENVALSDVKLFPNPAASEVNIQTPSIIDSVSLFDMSGKQVLSLNDLNTQNHKLNLQNLSKGLYLVRVKSQNTVINKKLLIQ